MTNEQCKNVDISVIVPVYNVEQYLRRCIDSILRQRFKNYEIILIDDGSTDDSGNICDEYMQKFENIDVHHIPNGGLSSARNFGLKVCNGQYVSFVDSDDYVSETYLSDMFFLAKQNECDLVISAHTIVTRTKKIPIGDGSVGIIQQKDLFEKIFYSEMFDVSAWGKLFLKKLFNNIEFPNGKQFEDSATTYKLVFSALNIGYIMNSNYFYVLRNNSITGQNFNKQKLDFIRYTDQMVNDVVDRYPELRASGIRRKTYARINTLGVLANSYKNNRDLATKLVNDILIQYKSLIKNRRVPMRDKISLIILRYTRLQGFYVFYRIYTKLK